MIQKVDLEHMYFQYLIGNVYFLSQTNNEENSVFGDWVKNVDRFQKNEGGDQLKIIFCILLMMSSMYSQLITRFKAMSSLLGDLGMMV